jgi:hypothetical protein
MVAERSKKRSDRNFNFAQEGDSTNEEVVDWARCCVVYFDRQSLLYGQPKANASESKG